MADTLEERLAREYREYAAKEKAAGNEPIAEYRWQVKRLDEMEAEESKPAKAKVTKKTAKKGGSRVDYMKYRKQRIDYGRSYMSYDQWLSSRGE